MPLVLPERSDYKPAGDGLPPLAKEKDWVNTTFNGQKAQRETNTRPQWAGSSWYYARYIDPHNKNEIGDKKLLDHWLPVDVYVGGAEHAVLHLLYARFWHKFLHDEGIFKSEEPFQKLYHQGLILGPDGQKRSKSLGNTVSPDDVIKEYGADALRFYERFKGPVDQSRPWSPDGPRAAKRFLDKFFRLYDDEEFVSKWTDEENESLEFVYATTIKKCTNDYEILHFNTGISQIMVCVNEFYKADKLPKKRLLGLAQLRAPITPHLAEECYSKLGYEGVIDFVKWPSANEDKISARPVTYAIQVNGKLRSTIEFKKDATPEELEELKKLALNDPKVTPFLANRTVVKVIAVKNKIVSIVVKKNS